MHPFRSVGVSNFGIQHLEGIKNSGRPLPSVNQVNNIFQARTFLLLLGDNAPLFAPIAPIVSVLLTSDRKMLPLMGSAIGSTDGCAISNLLSLRSLLENYKSKLGS